MFAESCSPGASEEAGMRGGAVTDGVKEVMLR